MNYNTISAQRIAGALGAEIAGVDLSRPLSDEVIGRPRVVTKVQNAMAA